MKAFILAAGLGTRLKPLTYKIPKVMIKIGDKPILEHLIILCQKHKILEIIINLHHFPAKIKGYFGTGEKWGVKITFSSEPKILGSAGALKKVEKFLADEDFFVLNGDVMTDLNLTKMWQYHQEKGGMATVLIHKSSHPYDSSLIAVDEEFRIINFDISVKPGEQRKYDFRNLTKSGTHIFKPEVLKYIPKGKEYSLERELMPKLISQGLPIYGFYSEDYSHDMGTLERLKQVRRDYEAGKIRI